MSETSVIKTEVRENYDKKILMESIINMLNMSHYFFGDTLKAKKLRLIISFITDKGRCLLPSWALNGDIAKKNIQKSKWVFTSEYFIIDMMIESKIFFHGI